MSVFGNKLKELREHRQETQPELAKVLDVTIRQVQRYEDETLPPLEKIKQLAIHYQYDFFRLFSDEIFPNENQSKTNQSDKGHDHTEEYIQLLKKENERLQKQFDEMKNHIDIIASKLSDQLNTNLIAMDRNQHLIMGQILAASYLAAERFAGKDRGKFQKEIERLGTLSDEFSSGNAQKDILKRIHRTDKVDT